MLDGGDVLDRVARESQTEKGTFGKKKPKGSKEASSAKTWEESIVAAAMVRAKALRWELEVFRGTARRPG